MFLFRKVFDNYIDSCTQKQAECTSFMVEAINGFESVKGCLLEEKVINDYECKYSKFLNETYTFDNVYNIQYLFKEIISNPNDCWLPEYELSSKPVLKSDKIETLFSDILKRSIAFSGSAKASEIKFSIIFLLLSINTHENRKRNKKIVKQAIKKDFLKS